MSPRASPQAHAAHLEPACACTIGSCGRDRPRRRTLAPERQPACEAAHDPRTAPSSTASWRAPSSLPGSCIHAAQACACGARARIRAQAHVHARARCGVWTSMCICARAHAWLQVGVGKHRGRTTATASKSSTASSQHRVSPPSPPPPASLVAGRSCPSLTGKPTVTTGPLVPSASQTRAAGRCRPVISTAVHRAQTSAHKVHKRFRCTRADANSSGICPAHTSTRHVMVTPGRSRIERGRLECV